MMLLHALLLLYAFPSSNAKGRLRQFYRGEERKNRTDAVNECQRKNTDLVTVYDQQDNMELALLIKVTGVPSGWIGAYTGNRSKKWSNGDEVTYKQDFVMICGETCCAAMKADGDWESVKCDQRRQFMCYEQDVGQASFNYSLIPETKTWFEAQLYCREYHTDLVSIRDDEENKRVKEAKNTDSCWIGLLQDSVEWNDGGQSTYRNFANGQQGGDYIQMLSNGSWRKSKGDSSFIPLCYKSVIHVSSSNMSWEEALDYCHQNTSGLLRIESKDDQIETERELKMQRISGPVWVGLRQSRLFGFWIWYDGLHVGPWTNWKGGSPPEHLMSEHCGAIEEVNGQYKWCDKDCSSEFRVLCEGK